MPSRIDMLNMNIERGSIQGAKQEQLVQDAKYAILEMMKGKLCVEFDTDYLNGKKVNKLCYNPINADLWLTMPYSDDTMDVNDLPAEDVMTLWNWVRDVYDGV